jgi:hypothetical protein
MIIKTVSTTRSSREKEIDVGMTSFSLAGPIAAADATRG